MLDYKDIIIKHYALHMSGRKIAEVIGASKSGVNDFLKAFERCESLSYPLPSGITNYGIAELVYGKTPDGKEGRDLRYELPDFPEVEKQMTSQKNMTLVFLWGRYKNRCVEEEKRFYSYRQFCDRYMSWRGFMNQYNIIVQQLLAYLTKRKQCSSSRLSHKQCYEEFGQYLEENNLYLSQEAAEQWIANLV